MRNRANSGGDLLSAPRVMLIALALGISACAGPGAGSGDAAGAPGARGPSLLGGGLAQTQWVVTTLLGKAIPVAGADGSNAFDFAAADRGRGVFNATIGCNRIGGQYQVGERSLRMLVGRSTKQACRGELGMAERRMIAAIGATTAYRRNGDVLEFLSGDRPLAILRRR